MELSTFCSFQGELFSWCLNDVTRPLRNKENFSCFIFLQIYSIANLNDVSWGTRQGPKKNNDLEETKGFLGRLFGITQERF